MKFVGGNDLVFSLIALVLLGIVIFIFEKVSYVFDPFIIVFKTIAAPIIVSLILFYLFNPIVNMMERYRIPRVAGISIIYLAIVGPKYGTTLVTAAILANTKLYFNPITE